jgi:hypothetical protein
MLVPQIRSYTSTDYAAYNQGHPTYKQGPELKIYPYQHSGQNTQLVLRSIQQKKVKEDRSSLINAGINNLGFLNQGSEEAQQSLKAYGGL